MLIHFQVTSRIIQNMVSSCPKECHGGQMHGLPHHDVRPWITIYFGAAKYKRDGISPMFPIPGSAIPDLQSRWGQNNCATQA